MTGTKDSESTSYDDQITVTLVREDPDGVQPNRRGWRRQLKEARWDLLLPLFVFIGLVFGGITTSSIGVDQLRVSPGDRTGTIGVPLPIRSDEWTTGTPTRLGIAERGGAEQLNPLAADASFSSQTPIGPFTTITFFDTSLLQLGTFLPQQMLLAFVWWLPFLLLALALPYFFGFLTGSRWPGWIAFALIAASPVDVWWSNQIVGMLGFIVAGSAALVKSCEWAQQRVIWKSLLWGLASILLLARTPFQYQPWMIVLGPVVLLIVIVPLLSNRSWWRLNLATISIIALLSLGLFALTLLEAKEGFTAASETIYPGSRRSSGGPVSFWLLFGAPQLYGIANQGIVDSNHSEISSSYLILAVLSLVIVLSGYKFASREQKSAWIVAAAGTGFWILWSAMNFGRLGTSMPLLSMVTPTRSAAVVGVLGTLMFSLTITTRRQTPGLREPMAAAFLGFAFTGYAGSLMQAGVVPGLTTRHIVVTAFIVGTLFFTITRWPSSRIVYTALVLGSFIVVFKVNPIQVGLGDLQDSELAAALSEEGANARESDSVWATDSMASLDPLLTANGVPSLSSRQMSGPVEGMWRRLDPLGTYEEAWNRGGSFITFSWTEDTVAKIENPGPDIIRISIDPCYLSSDFPELVTIVSYEPLERSCLVPDTTLPGGEEGAIEFGGSTWYVYDLVR